MPKQQKNKSSLKYYISYIYIPTYIEGQRINFSHSFSIFFWAILGLCQKKKNTLFPFAFINLLLFFFSSASSFCFLSRKKFIKLWSDRNKGLNFVLSFLSLSQIFSLSPLILAHNWLDKKRNENDFQVDFLLLKE